MGAESGPTAAFAESVENICVNDPGLGKRTSGADGVAVADRSGEVTGAGSTLASALAESVENICVKPPAAAAFGADAGTGEDAEADAHATGFSNVTCRKSLFKSEAGFAAEAEGLTEA